MCAVEKKSRKPSKLYKKSRLVFGVGINDADYAVETIVNCERQRCPFYRPWSSMLKRCYSEKLHAIQATYIGCSVVNEWHSFMNFRAWMISQDWKGKCLDKDIIEPGNKVYSPDKCIFISNALNSLLTDHAAGRGIYALGVSLHESGKFTARCRVFGKDNLFLVCSIK